MDPLNLIHVLTWDRLPGDVHRQVELCLLDLIRVSAGGVGTRLSGIIRDHATECFGGAQPMLFDQRAASPAGMASNHDDRCDGI